MQKSQTKYATEGRLAVASLQADLTDAVVGALSNAVHKLDATQLTR